MQENSSHTDTGSNSNVKRRNFIKALGASGFIAGTSGSALAQETTTTGQGIDLDAIEPNDLVGKGPNGNDPVPAEQVSLSDSQVQKLKQGNYTVAIVFHYLKTAWTRLQRRGLTNRLNELGINVEGVYGAEFDAAKQVNILNTLASKADSLDAVISIPVDQVATADAYQNLANKGVKLVFMDNVPEGFSHPEDYAGAVAADNKGNGLIAGRILAKLVGQGSVGLIMHDAPFYVTNEREQGVKQALKNASGIEIAATNGFTNPDKVFGLAQNMLTANPDLDGIFAIWGAPPAMQVVSAANASNRSPIITTIDLGSRVALNMAKGGLIKGLGAQQPYDQGVTEANMAGNAILGAKTPPYVAVQSLAVMRKNLLKAYRSVFHQEPPQKITKHYDQ